MQLVADRVSGGRGGFELFSGISMILENGEGLVITGPNGAGKSTLLRILTGLLLPSHGTVRFLDDAGTHMHDAFHYLGTSNAMKDQLTVKENLHFWKGFQTGVSGSGLEPVDALQEVNLGHVAGLPFGYLSTGQKRRVALARLLLSDRPVWIIDEPTSGLDTASGHLFASLASKYLRSGGILVAASHIDLRIDGLRHLQIGNIS